MTKRTALAALTAGLFITVPNSALAQTSGDYERGVAARLAGDTDLALQLLRRAAASEPVNADAQLQYGLALFAAGRVDEAEQALRRTLQLAPNYEDAHEALSRVRQNRQDNQRRPGSLELNVACRTLASRCRRLLQLGARPIRLARHVAESGLCADPGTRIGA